MKQKDQQAALDTSSVAETIIWIEGEGKTYEQGKVRANGTKVGKQTHGETKLFTSDCQHVLLLLFAKVLHGMFNKSDLYVIGKLSRISYITALFHM